MKSVETRPTRKYTPAEKKEIRHNHLVNRLIKPIGYLAFIGALIGGAIQYGESQNARPIKEVPITATIPGKGMNWLLEKANPKIYLTAGEIFAGDTVLSQETDNGNIILGDTYEVPVFQGGQATPTSHHSHTDSDKA
jgi:hypothetical protein